MRPVSIKTVDGMLVIQWDNNESSNIRLTDLRYYCPCAHCEKLRDADKVDHIHYFKGDQVEITNIHLTGQYALSIVWADGHNTGIYEFPLLQSLSYEKLEDKS